MTAAPAADQTASSAPPTAGEFEAFDRFPWSKHRTFLLGLIETLGGPSALRPSPTHEGNAAFCRTVFFRRQTGRRVDLIRYSSFLGKNPEYPSIDRRLLGALYAAAAAASAEQDGLGLSELSLGDDAAPAAPTNTDRNRRIAEAVASGPVINPFDGTPTPPFTDDGDNGDGGSDVPSWQRSAPKNELKVARPPTQDGTGGGGDGGPSGTGEAPYSDKFAKVVEAIQTGKELEGIRQIPDTVVRQAGITPMGKLKAPRKPWEMAATAAPVESILSYISPDPAPGEQQQQQQGATGGASLVDLEFPPPPTTPPPAAESSSAENSTEGAVPS